MANLELDATNQKLAAAEQQLAESTRAREELAQPDGVVTPSARNMPVSGIP